MGRLIADAIAAAVNAVLTVAAHTGVSAEDIEAAKQSALRQIADIKSAEVAAFARQWRIAQGLEQ